MAVGRGRHRHPRTPQPTRLGRVAYLDFNGRALAGTAWADASPVGPSALAAAWGLDGDPSHLSAAERSVVLEIWRRVAEDFAPFDIDITTEEPPPGDLSRTSTDDSRFGTTVVVTPSDEVVDCVCGGVSYVGVFDRVGDHDRYQPSFVFSDLLGTDNAKHLSEAISHEIGHTLGLGHVLAADGSYFGGQGPWAPIMGVSYYRPLTQWMAGDSVAGRAYDDVAMITRHGLAPLGDDHVDGLAGATLLGAGPSIVAAGVITTRGDVDMFVLTTSGGPLSITVAPDEPGANLDLRLELLRPSGEPIAQVDPATRMETSTKALGLGATVEATVAAGTYFVRVDGAGSGAPDQGGYSDGGSLWPLHAARVVRHDLQSSADADRVRERRSMDLPGDDRFRRVSDDRPRWADRVGMVGLRRRLQCRRTHRHQDLPRRGQLHGRAHGPRR